MKRITAVILLIGMIFAFASCGIKGHEVETLKIDLKTGTLEGLSLGMSVEEVKKSGVFAEDKVEMMYGEGLLPFDLAYVKNGEGVTVLGEDSALEMFIIDGKLVAAAFDVNMDMTGRVSDFSEREEFFTYRAELIESALENALGEPTYYSAGGIAGSVYPGDDDKEAIKQIVYFVKDGKVLSKDKLEGNGLTEHYMQTDFDYAIGSMQTKSFIASEESLSTRSDAGTISLQITSKEYLVAAQNQINQQLSDRKSE